MARDGYILWTIELKRFGVAKREVLQERIASKKEAEKLAESFLPLCKGRDRLIVRYQFYFHKWAHDANGRQV